MHSLHDVEIRLCGLSTAQQMPYSCMQNKLHRSYRSSIDKKHSKQRHWVILIFKTIQYFLLIFIKFETNQQLCFIGHLNRSNIKPWLRSLITRLIISPCRKQHVRSLWRLFKSTAHTSFCPTWLRAELISIQICLASPCSRKETVERPVTLERRQTHPVFVPNHLSSYLSLHHIKSQWVFQIVEKVGKRVTSCVEEEKSFVTSCIKKHSGLSF